MHRSIEFFGPAKDYFDSYKIDIELADQSTAKEVKENLLRYLKNDIKPDEAETMLASTVIAAGDKMLKDDQYIAKAKELYVLPPVCGG